MPAKSKLSTGNSSFAQWNKKDPVVRTGVTLDKSHPKIKFATD